MTHKLWQSSGTQPLHPLVESYTVGDDFLLDQELLGYDIKASSAHAGMLGEMGLITKKEATDLQHELSSIYKQWQSGTFTVTAADEDGHTALESYLTKKLGSTGKKLHTGRSRNDQALVMVRLFLKAELTQALSQIKLVQSAFLKKLKAVGDIPMPGYTHTQKAMPTTVTAWLGSFADAFMDMQALVQTALNVIDQNPLGSAAGFGTALPIDRSHTTAALGFQKTQANPLYCGLSRGLFELIAVQAVQPLMLLAGKFANDMMYFTTAELGFFSLPATFTTGSSIMPHKHNYDVFEIMRGKTLVFGSYAQQLYGLSSSLGSGYHRDLQLTKSITVAAFRSVQTTLEILQVTVGQIQVDKVKLRAAMTPELQSVALIDSLVTQGIPFRDAYHQVKASLEEGSVGAPLGKVE